MTMTYEIRLKNHLDPCWHDWFEGWKITNLEEGEMLLTNVNVDQSALHGTLNKIRDLNLKLISVVEVNQLQPTREKSELDVDQTVQKKESL
jgi:hypothetical protein